MENMENNSALNWDSWIEDDDGAFVVMDEGDYNFAVYDMTRGRFPGSSKIQPCPKATITLGVNYNGSVVTVKTDLILNKALEWKISSFFRSIGQKKHGERMQMNWDKIIGEYGRAHFKPRTYTDKDGNERKANDVDYFIDHDPLFFMEDTDISKAGF